jgi:hypothetical protein
MEIVKEPSIQAVFPERLLDVGNLERHVMSIDVSQPRAAGWAVA